MVEKVVIQCSLYVDIKLPTNLSVVNLELYTLILL